ncbi:MAG: ArsR/SmtB family transcription factor [Bacteroidota bacterium]
MLTKADEFDVELGELAELAKSLSHPARLAILKFLAKQDTCICGDIVEELPLAQASVSRHLKVLKEAGLINVTQRGLTSCYCINPEVIGSLRRQFEEFFGSIELSGPPSC